MSEHAAEIISRFDRETHLLAQLRRRAAAREAKVVLPEGEDERTVAAACVLREMRLARPVLVGAAVVLHPAAPSSTTASMNRRVDLTGGRSSLSEEVLRWL